MALQKKPGKRIGALLAGLMLAILAGCKEEVIDHYQVPKAPPQRLLGAIIPYGKTTWFFKLAGPQTAVDKHADEFDQFIRSVRFPDKADEPITWKVPAEWGWREYPGVEMRYRTFDLGSKGSPLELTIIPLGGQGGTLLKNVNRWREQMGLPDVSEDDLPGLTREITVDGNKGTRVDIKSADQPGRGDRGAKP